MNNAERLVKKRKRSQNFTPYEIHILMGIVFKFREVIGNKKTDAATNKKKDAAWARIANLFNAASSETLRSAKTLKLKYDSIKKITKKKATKRRQELYKSATTQVRFSVAEEKVLAMCSNINGLEAENNSETAIASTDTKEGIKDIIEFEEVSVNSSVDPVNVLNIKSEDESNETESVETPRPVITPPLKPARKTGVTNKLNKFNRARLELVEIQKQIAKTELHNKQFEHELFMKQKKEEHEIRMLHLRNDEQRKQEEHNLKMEQFKK